MRNFIHAAVLCTALPASAQPVTEPRACQVTIARAPEDVRAVVEAWVRTEAQCSLSLEVRLVPTDGGLYLLAQDEQGRIRERIVPDAQTAGVLVASWIADDNAPLSPAPATAPPAPLAPLTAAPVLAPPAAESLAPPGMAPITITATTTRPTPRSSWLSLGALFPMGPTSAVGLRGEVDVIRWGAWKLGVAASIAASETPVTSYSSYGEMTMQDVKLVAYVARTWSWGRWHARPAIGAGLIDSSGDAQMDSYTQYYTLEGTFATVEASLVVRRDLGARWSAYAGPVATALEQRYELMTPASAYDSMYRGGLDVALFAGVGRRL